MKKEKAIQQDFFADLLVEEKVCPLKGRNITVSGTFLEGRSAVKDRLRRLGAADVAFDKVKRTTHYILLGDNPNQETLSYHTLYTHDGLNIRLLTPMDIDAIQEGHYEGYETPETMTKDLHITHEHIFWNPPKIAGLKNIRKSSPFIVNRVGEGGLSQNPLYGMEVFVHTSISDRLPFLRQELGYKGCYANIEILDNTDALLLFGDSEHPELQSQYDDLNAPSIDFIEKWFNKSKAQMLNLPFILYNYLPHPLQLEG